MNCGEARIRCQRRLDDGVADAALDIHLAECHECRTYGVHMRRLQGAMQRLRTQTESLRASDDFAPLVRPRQFVLPWRRGLAVAASIALLIVAVRFAPIPGRLEMATGPTPPRATSSADPRLGLSLRGESATKLLAVACPRTDPDVQVYFLYPKLGTVARLDEPPGRSR